MKIRISPKFKMALLKDIESAIWKEFESYKRVRVYISQWQEDLGFGEVSFWVVSKNDGEDIDLGQTLSNIDDETLLKIAVDLGVNTPDFIPSVANIENIFKNNYQTSQQTFQKALAHCYENPDNAISLANSALESIVKHILKDKRFINKLDRKKTLYALTQDLLKEFRFSSGEKIPQEIRNIGSSFLKLTQMIEQIRSNSTNSHGKLEDDYIVSSPLYAFFIVNSVATIGHFLIGYYETKFKPEYLEENINNKATAQDINEEDIPF